MVTTRTTAATQAKTAFDTLKTAHEEANKPARVGRPPKTVSPPNYMSKAQERLLKMAQGDGWVIRSIVSNTKTHKCAIAIEKESEVAWIASDGTLRSETEVLKASGAV
jgi:hypothetical protein